jgi:hypothetical protein
MGTKTKIDKQVYIGNRGRQRVLYPSLLASPCKGHREQKRRRYAPVDDDSWTPDTRPRGSDEFHSRALNACWHRKYILYN